MRCARNRRFRSYLPHSAGAALAYATNAPNTCRRGSLRQDTMPIPTRAGRPRPLGAATSERCLEVQNLRRRAMGIGYSAIFAATTSSALRPSAPNRRRASSWARRHMGKAACSTRAPSGARATRWLMPLLSWLVASQPRRRILCKLRLAVDLSIATSLHSSAAESGPCRLSIARIPNCEIFSLRGANASS